MKRSFTWPALASALVAAAVMAAPVPEPKNSNSTRWIPGGVADADGTKGFVANDAGGVTALDLESGQVLWESKTAGRPLAATGAWVWVLVRDKDKANVLRVVGLGRDDGKAAVETDPVVLPDWVSAVEGQGAGRSFTCSASLDGLDLFLKWQANAWYWGGAAPPPQVEAAARKHADGVARINLYNNEVEMLETAKAPPPAGPKVSKELEKAAARTYGPEGPTVATAGDYAVAVDMESADGKQKVVLKRWDLATEKPLDPLVLTQAAAAQVVVAPSAGVTLVRDATLPPGAPSADAAWTAYALATGKEMGRFTTEGDVAELAVVGSRVFYVARGPHKGPPFGGGVVPRTLKAVDLKTGNHLWEVALEGERLPPPPPP